MTDESDFDLIIKKASDADSSAIALLWKRHQPALVGWLCSMDFLVAEDIATEAWISVLGKLKGFSGDESHFRSWLFTIARRRLIDRHRKDGKRTDVPLADNQENIDSFDTSVEAISKIESQQAIAQITKLLSPGQAEVVLLGVVGGLNAAQIAEVIGKKTDAVRVLQHRGLRNLAKCLERQKKSFGEGVTI